VDANAVGGLLLPAGLWLLIASGAPLHHHQRLAAASLIALAIGTLTLVGWGFALAYGAQWQALSLGSDDEQWVFLGLQGFFLQGATDPENLNRLIGLWPLIVAGALLAANAVPYGARLAIVAFFTCVVSGLILPVVACWGWGGGWLATLGERAGLGRGMVDVGRLATVGLTTGAASLVWARLSSWPVPTAGAPQLPVTQFPVRVVAGVLLSMIGAAALNNGGESAALSSGQFVSTAVAVSAAILAAGLYTTFTTRHADVLSAGRAALAGVFITSSSGALLPLPVVLGLGLFCGLMATVGYYVVHEQWRWRDQAAIATSVLVPSAVGLLCTGLFANGSYGVAGLLSTADLNAAQLLAQVVGLFAAGLFAAGVSRIALWPIRIEAIPAGDTVDLPREAGDVLVDREAVPASPKPSASREVRSPAEQIISNAPSDATNGAAPEAVKRSLFGRFRRQPAPAPPPKQPRKVAYPYRVGGRPLSARPLVDQDDGSVESPSAGKQ